MFSSPLRYDAQVARTPLTIASLSTDLAGTTTSVAPDVLRTFHKNARRGDVDAIAGSLRAHSQYRPIVANIGTYTGRAFEVLAGNHTLLAIRKLAETYPDDPRWNSVKVHWGDWDETTCTKIVLADNRTSDLGTMDFGQLKELLDSLPDILATGYNDDDYADLAAALEELSTSASTHIDEPGVAPGSVSGGAGESEDHDDGDEDNSVNPATRMIILTMSIRQFVWAQQELEDIRDTYGHVSNVEAILALIAEKTGSDVPDADDTDLPE